MKSVNNEQALLAVLLLLLTSLSTVSGSMPTIQSIETYFEETKPNKGKPVTLNEPVEGFKRKPEQFTEKFGVNPGTDPQGGVSLGAAYGVDDEDIKELSEGFKNKRKEGFKNKKKGFRNKRKEGFQNQQLIEPFQGNLFATV